MNISVLGAGSWGIALTVLLAHNGHKVSVWSIDENEIKMLKEHREHMTKLPGIKIDESVTFTTDAAESVKDAEIIVMAVPSPFVRNTAKTIAPYVNKPVIVNVSKGIEEDTLMVLTDVILNGRSVRTKPCGGGWKASSYNYCGRCNRQGHGTAYSGYVYVRCVQGVHKP